MSPEFDNQDLFDNACHLIRTGQAQDALPLLETVLKAEPTDPTALRVYADALRGEKRYHEAITVFRRVLAHQPHNGSVWGCLGVCYALIGDLAESRACYDKALLYAPCHPEVHWNRALHRLIMGEWPEGWHEYRWGTVIRQKRLRTLQPEWDGTPKPGKTLLLWAEQGFGDTIQFLQLITPRVRESFAKIILEVQRDLVPLLAGQKFLDGIDLIEVQDDNAIPVPFDEHCGLMTLPSILELRIEDLPLATNYITAPIDFAGLWVSDGLRVGICWKGNPEHPNDHNRSLAPDDIDPLRKVEGIEWVCLQKGNLMHSGFKAATPALTSWEETANVISSLDLVITCDTGVAHLAAAMGKDTWVLLPYISDFRWLMDRTDSPFYPSVRLFRQSSMGDWAGVIETVQGRLNARANHVQSRISLSDMALTGGTPA